ncbi:hypothetical protein GCM10025772_11640 [Ferrimonas gelatinilytica]|uniref:L,D-TPase catalytic domain-containing protein n=1 Tax=Ferrimonas gelatinilytica TaxID=1255257 RepID=A0ABP9S0H2_9GAMM
MDWFSPQNAQATRQWSELLRDLGLSPENAAQVSREARSEALTQATLVLMHYQAQLQGKPLSNPGKRLASAVEQGALAAFLALITPQYQGFKRLRTVLAQELARTQLPVPELTPMEGLGLGQSHPELSALRQVLAQRLGQTLPAVLVDRDVWDPPFIHLLRDYQRQSGLTVTGTLTPETQRHLRVDPKRRIDTIRFSLLQWFQLPPAMDGLAILVNIPHYQLVALDQERVALVTSVVVGAPGSPTPRMNSRFSSITFNPDWTPPQSILRDELLPQWRADQGSLAAQGFVWETAQGSQLSWDGVTEHNIGDYLRQYRLKQVAGRGNPLGRMRLNLKNSQAIYLHDTNRPDLFGRTKRDLSHGCVRINNIDALFAVLKEQESSRDAQRLLRALNATQTQTQRLNADVDVFLVYMPAWVGADNTLQLRPDIYGLVQPELAAITKTLL